MARLTQEWKGYFLWSHAFIIMTIPRSDKDVAQQGTFPWLPKTKSALSKSNTNIYSASAYYLRINHSELMDINLISCLGNLNIL